MGNDALTSLLSRRDYPYTTVPNQVQRLWRAQTLHDRIHYDERVSEGDEERRRGEFDASN